MPTELIRVGLGDKPMTVARLKAVLDAAGADDSCTIRHRNGNLIVEHAPERPTRPSE